MEDRNMRLAIYSFLFGWIYKRLAQTIHRIRLGRHPGRRYILGDGFQVVALLGAAYLLIRRSSPTKTLTLLMLLLRRPQRDASEEYDKSGTALSPATEG
jgi:hypothetical protein